LKKILKKAERLDSSAFWRIFFFEKNFKMFKKKKKVGEIS